MARGNNEGTLFFSKAEDRWIAEVTLPNGKRKKKRTLTEKEAISWKNEILHTIHKGTYIENDKLTYGDFLTGYLKNIAPLTVKPKTLKTYIYLIENHIRPCLGHLTLTSIRAAHIQELYAPKVLEEGLSPKTVKHIHSLIRSTLNIALDQDLIIKNPIRGVKPPRLKKKKLNTLSEREANRFLQEVSYHRWYCIYLLALTTGLRQGEILGLHWNNIDFKNKKLYIVEAAQSVNGTIQISDTKTDDSNRSITLSKVTINALKTLKEKDNSDGLVFKTSNGTPISARNLLRHFHKVLEEGEFTKLRFHDLRHTAATLMLKNGVHPKIIQEMLGHSSINVTLNTYSHVIPDMQREAAKIVDKIFRDLK